MKNRHTIFTTILLALACFGVCPMAQAVTPPPDGGYIGYNTAEGTNALFSLSTGDDNTAIGFDALYHNTTGRDNTATGWEALLYNTTGYYNTAAGGGALYSNTTGHNNTATGDQALASNTSGTDNTANGYQTLLHNTTGYYNTANGVDALKANTHGSGNTAEGFKALLNNIGSSNIALGYNAGSNLTSGDNNIYLGSLGVATESNTIRIGTAGTQDRAFIRGIRGVTTENNGAIPVLIDTAGQLGTMSSSRRFKRDIKPMDSASEAILALKPVTFHYKSDTKDRPQFGLIAEEVAEVNPDLVVRDENGEIYTVRYEHVNAMLLNEFLKEHKAFLEEQRKVKEQDRRMQEQEATIAQLKCRVAKQEEGMEAFAAHMRDQDSKIQRVSDQLELRSSAPKVVMNKP